MVTLTSFDRKQRSVNAQDVASQFKKELKSGDSLDKLKTKNSELLAKYREKLRLQEDESNTSQNENESTEL